MPLDKVLSASIANAAVNASAISNTANLVIGALNTGNTVITGTTFANGTLKLANSTANVVHFLANGDITIGGNTAPGGESPLHIQTSDKSHVLHLYNTNSYSQIIYQANNYRYQTGVGYTSETTWGVANNFFIFDSIATLMRFGINSSGNVWIGNNVTKQAKLNFESIVGNKIDFYHNTSGNGDRYGVQVQSSELRIHSGAGGDANGGITFGKSTTSTFTENARLTNSGYLRVPNQPCFAAYGTDMNWSVPTGSGGIIPFNSVEYNVSSSFNTSTYTFTAPIAGKYYVSFSVLIYPQSIASGNYVTVWIDKNGSQSYSLSIPMARMSNKENQTTMSNDGVVNLAQGDTIVVRASCSSSGPTLYFATGHAHFHAYLLG